MKLGWINIVATILILGGVLLLVHRRMATSPPIPTAVSPEAAKADAIKRIEAQLGRPLNGPEHDMIEAGRNGDHISVVVHQPLAGRLAAAEAATAAGHAPSTQSSTTAPDSLPTELPTTLPEIGPASGTPNPTTIPG